MSLVNGGRIFSNQRGAGLSEKSEMVVGQGCFCGVCVMDDGLIVWVSQVPEA